MTHLYGAYPVLSATLPHRPLGTVPTPVERVPDILCDQPLWIKRDGEFGDGGWGGNKVRKLEWILPDVARMRRKSILTVGGLGTNWGLAAALYGRDLGINTTLMLLDQPVDEHVRAQQERLKASGARLHYPGGKMRARALAPAVLAGEFIRGHVPYFLPAGGSSPIGALGYVEAAFEIAEQVRSGDIPEPRTIVVPVGSGGTAAGLYAGVELAGLSTKVVGIVVNDSLRLDHQTISKLARRTLETLRDRGADLSGISLDPERLVIRDDWLGDGYGHSSAAGSEAAEVVEKAHGIHLDPVYNAKAVAGLRAMSDAGEFHDGAVMYIHTDGPRD